jgi:predicted ATP-dependent protease
VQAIGGVNEKIEGYFGVCEALGLRGDEGVLIPKSNVPHLMLNEKVKGAIADGKFHIYPIATIDEGISILTGVPAGECDEQGNYPEGTVNRAVIDRLKFLAEKARELEKKKEEEEGPEKHKKEEPQPEPTPPQP